MKVLLAFFLIPYMTTLVSAQCKNKPKLQATGKVIKKLALNQKEASETGLSINATVNGASWHKKGAEAAVITVFVNGKYNQDVILFAGSQSFEYKIILGRLEAGNHEISLVLNEARSAPNARRVTIYSNSIFFATHGNETNDAEKIAVANSPFIYARPNAVNKFSDIPLVTYYEIFHEGKNTFRIRYTTIFSNEDGGTQTTALMARWGRATDIEWVYEISYNDGKLVSETFQGPNHETKQFAGKRAFGNHPLIYTVTENNNFADVGCTPLRVAQFPIREDLANKSRETVMDEHPWTYRTMAEEAIREGRVDPKNMGVDTIDDLRNYLYVEVYAENNSSAIAVEAKTIDGKTSRSDFGDDKLRVERSGYGRIAVRLSSTGSLLHSLHLSCHSLAGGGISGSCANAKIVGFIKLDENFLPKNTSTVRSNARTLKPNENVVWLSNTNR